MEAEAAAKLQAVQDRQETAAKALQESQRAEADRRSKLQEKENAVAAALASAQQKEADRNSNLEAVQEQTAAAATALATCTNPHKTQPS